MKHKTILAVVGLMLIFFSLGFDIKNFDPSSITPYQMNGGWEMFFSNGQPVPVGQYEAVGEVPGCTATLITNQLVLSAAHCFCEDDQTKPCDTRTTFTLRSVFPVDNPSTPVNESRQRKDVSIDGKVRIHPEFNKPQWYHNDLALIELDRPIEQVALVKPIEIELPQNNPVFGETLTMIGFGDQGEKCNKPSIGKQKKVMKTDGANFAAIVFHSTTSHVCPGDSGGPLLNSRGRMVGVGSWGDFTKDSTYRPTAFSYNWILKLPDTRWTGCRWVLVEQAGISSHSQGNPWCPNGTYMVAFDLDSNGDISGHDSPVIGQAMCCGIDGAKQSWGACEWQPVADAGRSSHNRGPAWCRNGYLLVGLDLNSDYDLDPHDSPLIGQAQCCQSADSRYSKWGSSYWIPVEAEDRRNSHEAKDPWCNPGAFLTQLDLDSNYEADEYYSPIVGYAKCSKLRP